jgi:hypothetical protein
MPLNVETIGVSCDRSADTREIVVDRDRAATPLEIVRRDCRKKCLFETA